MPDYLADRFASWMGWGTDEEKTPNGYSGARGTDPAGRRKKPIDLLAADSPMRSNTALADAYAASGPGRSSQQQYGSVAPPSPGIIQKAQLASLGAPLQAREPPAGGPGVPPPMGRPTAPAMTAPRSPAGAGPPMAQQEGGGQPPPLAPSGAAPNLLGRAGAAVGDLLGGVRDWGNAPMYDPSKPTSRWDAIAMTLGNVGAGLSQTGRIGAGLRMGNQGLMQLRQDEQKRQESEEERQYRRLEMAYKQKKLEEEVGPKSHVLSAGGMLVGPNGEVIARADTAKKTPTSIEQALLSDEPEVRARAEELRDRAAEIKGTPTEHQRQTLELSRKRLEVEIAKANRPGGSPSAPAPTQVEKLLAALDALPPDHPNRKHLEAALAKETHFASDTGSATGGTTATGAAKPKPLPADMVGKVEAVKSGQAAAKRARDYYFPGGKFSGWEAGKASIPGVGGAVSGTMGVGAAGDIDSAIDAIVRVRTGAGARPDELDFYRRIYMPNASDNEEVAKAKLKRLDDDLAGLTAGFREARGLEREDPAAAAPPAGDEAPPAALDRLGKPATDEERATLPIARTKRDALSMPRGELFILPDGTLGMGRALRPSEGP